MRWKEQITKFGDDMEELSDHTLDRIIDQLGRGGERFSHLPYVSLKKLTGHRCGVLVLWPKMKTLHLTSWADLKWRPLASYAGHRWKRLLNIAAKWTNFVLHEINPGFHQSDPGVVLNKINSFNAGLREAKIDEPGALESETGDISDFFTHVSREEVLLAVRWFATMISRKHPGKSLF